MFFGGQFAIIRKSNAKEKANSKSLYPLKNKRSTLAFAVVLLIVLVLVSALIGTAFLSGVSPREPEVFVGVDVAYGGENEVYKVANAVEGYANLIVLGSVNLVTDEAALTRVCNFLSERGFFFIVYVAFSNHTSGLPPRGPATDFFSVHTDKWGGKLLGAYIFDEVGGKQIDYNLTNPDKPVSSANGFSDAAIHFILGVSEFLHLYKDVYYLEPDLRVYNSDYALYWYDYLMGYDVIFAEFLGNQSIQRQIATSLCRGAAHTLNKDWGIIITSTACTPGEPQLCFENGSELYNDMVLAWQSGAKYVVVFDAPNTSANSTVGILTQEHFDAIKSFWNYAKLQAKPEEFPADTAYVLPTDYGFGFRGPNDNIWGLWSADALAPKVWNDTVTLLATHNAKIDIVFQNRTGTVPTSLPYHTLIFWNGTIIQR